MSLFRGPAVRLPKALLAPPAVAVNVDPERFRRTYAKREWDALLAGDIVTAASRATDGHHADASGIVDRAPAQLWSLLVDFESRPDYLPGASEIRILKVAGHRVWLAERVKVLLFRIQYQVINTLDPPAGSLTWVLDQSVKNDIAATAGSWQLVPIGAGRQTLVRYSNVTDTGQPLPGAIEQILLKRSLPQMVSGVRGEAERRFR